MKTMEKFNFVFSTFRGNARMVASSYTIFPDGSITLNDVDFVNDEIDNLKGENKPLNSLTRGNLCRIEKCKIVQSWGSMKCEKYSCSPQLNEMVILFVSTEHNNQL